jgi:endonuclease/exonuclease/phosphatase (EEP) superfamily protein YafD
MVTVSIDTPGPPRRANVRPEKLGIRQRLSQLWRGIVVVMVLAVLVGQICRDRILVTALLFYVPPVLVAIVAAGTALACRAKFRVHLFCFAFLLVSLLSQFGFRSTHPSTAPTIRLVQWNVLWGGTGGESSWPKIVSQLRNMNCDLILLNEAPNPARVDAMLQQLGANWSAARFHHRPGERYTCHLVVASKYNVILEDTIITPDARMICCRIAFPQRNLRVLLVDGLSTITLLRSDRLRAVRAYAEQAQRENRAIDFIAGDFNSPANCVGFDDFATMAGGFDHAADFAHEWRGTWPVVLPAMEIDHVWVSRRNRITGVDLFTSLHSDHRGQMVDIALPE